MQHLLDRLLILAVRHRVRRSVSNARADGAQKRRSDQQGVPVSGLQAAQTDHRTQKRLQKAKIGAITKVSNFKLVTLSYFSLKLLV